MKNHTKTVGIQQLITMFLFSVQTEGKSPRTYEYYEKLLKQFVKYLQQRQWPDDAPIDTTKIREFLAWVSTRTYQYTPAKKASRTLKGSTSSHISRRHSSQGVHATVAAEKNDKGASPRAVTTANKRLASGAWRGKQQESLTKRRTRRLPFLMVNQKDAGFCTTVVLPLVDATDNTLSVISVSIAFPRLFHDRSRRCGHNGSPIR